MEAKRNSHCSYCGQPFDPAAAWPRTCGGCGRISYLNPIPVAVVLLPVDDGLLMVRRSIEPCAGLLALPGGFINLGETWQAAAARELYEETGIVIDPAEVNDFRTLSAPDGVVLIFGLARARTPRELPAFVPTNETSEVVVANTAREFCFPLHRQAAEEYFRLRQAGGAGATPGRHARVV